jgi:hypothetical protein
LDIVVEFLSMVVAIWIYGPDRNPTMRVALRVVAFGGAAVAILYAFMHAFQLPMELDVPLVLVLFWLFCFVTVMSAEYYVGIPWLSIATLIIGFVLLGLIAIPYFFSFSS